MSLVDAVVPAQLDERAARAHAETTVRIAVAATGRYADGAVDIGSVVDETMRFTPHTGAYEFKVTAGRFWRVVDASLR